MSLTLATVADALIEFILSLLQDPEVRAEFEEDPDAALAQRGLNHVSPADVQAVAPVIIERTQVVQVPVVVRQQAAQPEQHHSNPVVREIQQVSQNFSWVDDRDTIVDQSVNQNIWAKGDVTQNFDNDAMVASGDEAIAAGGSVDVDKTYDHSTNIHADDDVNIGNKNDVTTIGDSFNEDTDTDTTTDDSTNIDLVDSGNDQSTDVDISDSLNEQIDESTTVDIDSALTVVGDATDVLVDGSEVTSQDAAQTEITQEEAPVEEAPVEEAPAEQQVQVEAAPIEAQAETADAGYTDSAVEYTELESDTDLGDSAFEQTDVMIDEGTADDNF